MENKNGAIPDEITPKKIENNTVKDTKNIFKSPNVVDLVKNDINEILTKGNEVEINSNHNFPFEVFPLPIQKIIIATHNDLSFPIDFISASILFAVSVAIGNTYRLKVKNSWIESAVLYLAIVGKAGTNKSHPLSFALKPIQDHDFKTFQQYELQRREFENSLANTKKDKESVINDSNIRPTWKRFILSDFTQEALTEVHKFNKRGIGVYVDELTGWFQNFNRYNKGSEMQFWLSAFNSKEIKNDRKSSEPICIPLPFISVAGTIQNALLTDLAKDNRSKNGFIDRMLFVIPEDVKKEYWSDSDLDPGISNDWQNIISKLISIEVQYDDNFNPVPNILQFDTEAKRLLFAWQRENTDQSNQSADDEIGGIYSKLETYAIRFALILEMMQYACDSSNCQSVSSTSVNGALKLIEYFKNSAIKVYSIISNSSPRDKLPKDKQLLFDSLPDSFTTEEGLIISKSLIPPVAERTFKDFLNKKELFIRASRGKYTKIN